MESREEVVRLAPQNHQASLLLPRYLLSRRIKRTVKDPRFYEILSQWSCGAFDGGCLMVAAALHHLLEEGHFYTLWGVPFFQTMPNHQHVVLRRGVEYVDGDGISTEGSLRHRWRTVEHVHVEAFLPLDDFDILVRQGVPFCESTVLQLAALFEEHIFT